MLLKALLCSALVLLAPHWDQAFKISGKEVSHVGAGTVLRLITMRLNRQEVSFQEVQLQNKN